MMTKVSVLGLLDDYCRSEDASPVETFAYYCCYYLDARFAVDKIAGEVAVAPDLDEGGGVDVCA